ncbi:MAG: hypothetical protein ACHQ4J_14270 [Candidatus Binatia bacterium]
MTLERQCALFIERGWLAIDLPDRGAVLAVRDRLLQHLRGNGMSGVIDDKMSVEAEAVGIDETVEPRRRVKQASPTRREQGQPARIGRRVDTADAHGTACSADASSISTVP